MQKTIALLVVFSFLVACTAPVPSEESAAPEDSKEGNALLNVAETASVLKEVSSRTLSGPSNQHKVAYTFENPDGSSSQATTYFKNENMVRFDLVGDGQVTQTYAVNGVYTMCTQEEGSDQFTCLKVTETNNPTSDITIMASESEEVEELEDEGISYRAYRDGTITVTGHTADCYAFEYGDVRERTCISKENVLLYHKFTEGAAVSEFIATEYATSFSDDVFEIPAGAEIVDLNQELADLQNDPEYQAIASGVEELGTCYAECDAQSGSDEDLEACYQSCLW